MFKFISSVLLVPASANHVRIFKRYLGLVQTSKTRSPAFANNGRDAGASVTRFLYEQRSLTGDTYSNDHNTVYWQAYIAEVTFKGHPKSLITALIDSLDSGTG